VGSPAGNRRADPAQDRYFYEEVCRLKDLASVDRYLDKGRLKTMTKEVQACKDHLRLKRGDEPCPKLTLKIKRIDWVDHWNDTENVLTVLCNNNRIIQKSGLASTKRGSSSEDVCQHALENVKLNDRWKLAIDIFLAGSFLTRDYRCKVEVEGRPEEFHNRTFELTGNCTNRVTLEIPDLPMFPNLPNWRDAER
jgi:hypothetical protein